MSRRRAVLLIAVLALAAPFGCSKDKPADTASLPDPVDLLREASTQMREVETARFTIDTSGKLDPVPLRRAEGQLTRAGSAKGKVKLDQAGTVTELDFVIVGSTAHIKGPTGGWQSVPLALASSVYDPSAILDPNRGVAKLMDTARDARTEARETIDGTAAYRVGASFDPQTVGALVPGAGAGVTGQIWIAADSKRLVQIRFKLPAQSGGEPATVTVRFNEYNQPVTISAP